MAPIVQEKDPARSIFSFFHFPIPFPGPFCQTLSGEVGLLNKDYSREARRERTRPKKITLTASACVRLYNVSKMQAFLIKLKNQASLHEFLRMSYF